MMFNLVWGSNIQAVEFDLLWKVGAVCDALANGESDAIPWQSPGGQGLDMETSNAREIGFACVA
jgi:hypothetical protein